MSIAVRNFPGAETQSISELVFLEPSTETLPRKHRTRECIGIIVNNESPINSGPESQCQPKQSIVCISGVADVKALRASGANIRLGERIDHIGVDRESQKIYLCSQKFGEQLPDEWQTRWRSLGIQKGVASKVLVGMSSLSQCSTTPPLHREDKGDAEEEGEEY